MVVSKLSSYNFLVLISIFIALTLTLTHFGKKYENLKHTLLFINFSIIKHLHQKNRLYVKLIYIGKTERDSR